jgi:lipoprotein NlpI
VQTSLPLVTVFFLVCALYAADADELLEKANDAFTKGQHEEALALAGKAIEQEPKSVRPYLFRGSVYEALHKHTDAVNDFSKALTLNPKAAEAYNRRGSEYFKLGEIDKSLADFDKYLELKPSEKNGHWKRGISLYYAGKFDEGRKQFEGYEKVDTNDVENAVWHFLCAARADGVEKARANLLKIGRDRRVPMTEVYGLFAAKLKPADVLAAAEAGDVPPEQRNAQRFYAQLYLGLYAEATGDKKQALEHLTTAAEKHKIGHYMWDVSRVGRDLLKKSLEKDK